MSQNKKSIADALAEVQLKVNEDKRIRAARMAEEAGLVDEGVWDAGANLLVKGIRGAQSIGKTVVRNVKKGAEAGASGTATKTPQNINVSPSGTQGQTFAKKGGIADYSQKAGEVAGKGVKVVTDNPGKAGLAAGAAIGAGTTAALKGSSSDDANAAETPAAPLPPRRPADLGTGNAPAAPAPRTRAAAPTRAAEPVDPHAKSKAMFSAATGDNDTAANFFAADKQRQAELAGNGETESGGKSKGKKKMSESMIEAFLALQNTKAGNVFEAAKKLKGNQGKLDKNHNGKLDKEDFKMLRGKKMEEDVEYVEEERMSKGRKDALARKTSFTADPPRRLEPEPKKTKSEKIKEYRADRDKHGEMEESIFSEAELEHIASILEINDQSVSARQLTDEETEAPAKRGRGRPAGSRSGSTYGDEGPAEPKRVAAQIRDVKSYFNNDKKEVVKITHPTKGSTHEVGIKAANDFNRDYAGAGKPAHKDAVEAAFVKKHMGG